MSQRDLEDAILSAAATARHGTWLVIFPASGVVRRVTGPLFVFDVGGAAGVSPFLMIDRKQFMMFDPRVVIVDDRTLEFVWRPRDHIDRIEAGCRDWLRQNPDVFNTDPPKESVPCPT